MMSKIMPQDDDSIFRKDLSEERIQELQKMADTYRYKQNCITAAVVGTVIAVLIAMPLGVVDGIYYIVVSAVGAAAGYAFYAWGKYLEEKHKNDTPLESPNPDDSDKNKPLPEVAKSQPLCPGCLEPIDPLNYYCPKCGHASGQLTPYIPFVNIRFNYSIFGRLWHKLWYEKTSLPMKIISAAMIVVFVPIMLIGLPFVLWEKFSSRKKQNESDHDEEQEGQD
jgi:hypothetical protein